MFVEGRGPREGVWAEGCTQPCVPRLIDDRNTTSEKVVVEQTHHSDVFPAFAVRIIVIHHCTPNLRRSWANIFNAADSSVAEDDVEELLGVVHGLEPGGEHGGQGLDHGAPDDHADVAQARVRADAVERVLRGGVLGPERSDEQLRQSLRNVKFALFCRSRDFEVVGFFAADVFGPEDGGVVDELLKVELGLSEELGQRLEQLRAVRHTLHNVRVAQFLRSCVSAAGRSASFAAYTYIFTSRALIR